LSASDTASGVATGATRPQARSHLYVPADKPEMLAKALGRGADALIVDLEDAVAPTAKDEARRILREWLATLPVAADNPVEIWVRVNPAALALVDVDAVASPAITGFCVAKAETADEVESVSAALDVIEERLDLPNGTFAIAPLLESAAAVFKAPEIAKASRVKRLQVGEADLRADVGFTLGDDERELLFVRSMVVLASAAAGIDPPVGPVSPNFRDHDALRESTLAVQRLGYLGRACIHPGQLAIVNDVFTPSDESVEAARSLIERFDAAIASGAGVFVDNGKMVDEAVVRQARRTLALAR
jgi:citrate lyase subunit beta / citryl-CoA lyase